MSPVVRSPPTDAPRPDPARGNRCGELPHISPFLARGFHWYVPRYLRKHFNAVRLLRRTAPGLPPDEAVICFGNHPGWWDPLIAVLLALRFFPERQSYAPIDAAALQQYPVFRKLGFYGIDLKAREGARHFLTVTRRLLQQPDTVIWMTPGGRFADVRTRTRFQPGLAHLAATVPRVHLLPVAVEYVFWEERHPEALVAFGTPIASEAQRGDKEAWQRQLEIALAAAQEKLAQAAISRDAAAFEVLLSGEAGVGGWYDLARQLRCWVRGRAFDPHHAGHPAGSASLHEADHA